MSPRAKPTLRKNRGGATALEFALAALPLLLLIMGTVEGGLLFWSWQALESTAIDAARCAAINATACKNSVSTPVNTQNYAAATGTSRGLISFKAANVTVSTGAAAQAVCGRTTVSVVSVSLSYHYPAMAVVPLPTTLVTSACFPFAAGVTGS